MKIARYVIERNQVIDLINILKKFLREYDDKGLNTCGLIKNNHMEVQIKIEENKNETKS
jgi:hypothetical protein